MYFPPSRLILHHLRLAPGRNSCDWSTFRVCSVAFFIRITWIRPVLWQLWVGIRDVKRKSININADHHKMYIWVWAFMALSVPHRFYYFVAIRELCYFWLLLVLLLGAISVFSVIIAIISIVITLVITEVISVIVLFFWLFCCFTLVISVVMTMVIVITIVVIALLVSLPLFICWLSDKWLFMNVKDCRTWWLMENSWGQAVDHQIMLLLKLSLESESSQN